MELKQTQFFWFLDNEVPSGLIQDYMRATKSEENSNLSRVVKLVSQHVPIPPQAYLSPSFYEFANKKVPGEFLKELSQVVGRFEKLSNAQLGNRQYPLLLTVQGDFCGAIRNIGVNDHNLPALIHQYGSGATYSLYVDFLESFSSLVLGCPHMDFRQMFHIEATRDGGSGGLVDLSEDQFLGYVFEYQNQVMKKTGRNFPPKAEQQLFLTLQHCAGVAKKTGGDEIFIKTQNHRGLEGKSVKGAVYTRNPFSGRQDVYGVYEYGREGRKAVIETSEGGHDEECLRDRFPEIYSVIRRHLSLIETCFAEVMEVEFITNETGQLFFVGFDKAQKTSKATIVSAVELNTQGVIPDLEAALRIKPNDVEVLMHPTLTDESREKTRRPRLFRSDCSSGYSYW